MPDTTKHLLDTLLDLMSPDQQRRCLFARSELSRAIVGIAVIPKANGSLETVIQDFAGLKSNPEALVYALVAALEATSHGIQSLVAKHPELESSVAELLSDAGFAPLPTTTDVSSPKPTDG